VRYFLEITYNGNGYAGWQIQPNAPTIQHEIENALSIILRQNIQITGAGRTDAGVHALQMFAHFDNIKPLPDNVDWKHKLNSLLPSNIAIKNILAVKPSAHARFDAVSRSYIYVIGKEKNPFKTGLYYKLSLPLNVSKMNEAASKLLHHTDFTSFSKLHTDTYTNNCVVSEAYWEEKPENELIFHITANRFLRNMVRAIVGTLILVGREKLSVEEFEEIIIKKDRGLAGASAPAEGLFLQKIIYPREIFL
jgi:tRNA pseudouridine38-40 synthase